MWNPWRGCKKCSDGCLHCYIHKGDFKRGINTNDIIKTNNFNKPIEKLKNGNYKMKSGLIYMCFSTDYLIELVIVGGESDVKARPLNYDWVLNIREQCIRKGVDFEFRQCGTHFIKDGKQFKIQTKDLTKQARLANINLKSNK